MSMAPTLWRHARLATMAPGTPWGWIDDGALLVRTEHGHLERIIGGDVTLEK